jgi:hypothetical protein
LRHRTSPFSFFDLYDTALTEVISSSVRAELMYLISEVPYYLVLKQPRKASFKRGTCAIMPDVAGILAPINPRTWNAELRANL